MMRSFLLLLFCLPVLGAAAQPAFIKDSLDTYINREMKRWQIPGLAIAIVKDGKVVVEKGYGVQNINKPDSVNAYTLFQIASNSKAFTGTAIAMLHHEKRLKLDEKVTAYLPYFRMYDSVSTQLCTVRDVLSHRLGMQTFQGDFLNWGSNLTRKEIVEGLSRTKPVHPFRYKYGYCNAGFVTAGEIINSVTDTAWDEFLQARIFGPLQMKHTSTYYQFMANNANACAPHTLVKGKLVKIPLANIDNMGASASIVSCVADMKNWMLLQLNNGKFNNQQIIPQEVIMETRKSNTIVNDVYSKTFKSKHFTTYGLGWVMSDYEGRRIIEHSGGANGFVTKTELVPEENLGVIVYTNTDANSLYDALCKQVLEAYLNVPYRNVSEMYFTNSAKNKAEEERLQQAITDSVNMKFALPLPQSAYVGKYKNDLYGTVEVKLIKNKLQLFFEHHPNNIGMLHHIKDNRFTCVYIDVVCGVEPVSFTMLNNKITGIRVKVNDFIDYLNYDFEKID